MRGGLAGHAESLRSCGEALGACVVYGRKAPRKQGGRKGATERLGCGHANLGQLGRLGGVRGKRRRLVVRGRRRRASRRASSWSRAAPASRYPQLRLSGSRATTRYFCPPHVLPVANRSDRTRRGQAHLRAGRQLMCDLFALCRDTCCVPPALLYQTSPNPKTTFNAIPQTQITYCKGHVHGCCSSLSNPTKRNFAGTVADQGGLAPHEVRCLMRLHAAQLSGSRAALAEGAFCPWSRTSSFSQEHGTG